MDDVQAGATDGNWFTPRLFFSDFHFPEDCDERVCLLESLGSSNRNDDRDHHYSLL